MSSLLEFIDIVFISLVTAIEVVIVVEVSLVIGCSVIVSEFEKLKLLLASI